MAELLPVKKIYCDTKFRRKDSVSTSNFKIDLPETLKLPDNCVFFVDDIAIPVTWHTVQTGLNDKIYFRLTTVATSAKADYIATLTDSNYTLTEFAAELKTKINAITSLTSCVCTPHTSNNTLDLTLGALYTIQVFTDSELKIGVTWTGTAYDANNLQSINAF